MPRYFQHGGAAGSRSFGCFQMVSGPGFRACLPARRRSVSTGVAAGPLGGPPGCLESWPGGRLFCPFCPAFSGPEGGAGGPGRGDFRRAAKNGPVQEKCEGVSQLRVVGFTRSALCNERSFRTDVSICTIFSYGSARAGVQEKCPAAGEGGTGGVLV